VESDPQAEPLQPVPLKLQVTAGFDVPGIVAVKACIPAAGTEMLVGLMLSGVPPAATTVTLAEADFVGSATLVAVTLTVTGEGALDGEVYSPLFEMVPHAAPLHPVPLTTQLTEVFELPVTVEVNC